MTKSKKLNPANQTTLDDFGKRLMNEVIAGDVARKGLDARWRKLWSMYKNEPGASGVEVIPELPPEHVPIMRPAIRRIVDSVSSALFSVSPMVSALDCVDHEHASILAKQYDKFLTRGDARRKFKQAAECASICGIGVLYAPFIQGEGFQYYNILPERFFITPVEDTDVKTSICVGHQSWITEAQYLRGIETGRYLDRGDNTLLPSSTPDINQVTRTATNDKSLSTVPSMERGTEQSTVLIELRQVFWNGEFKELEKVYYSLYPGQKPDKDADGDDDGAEKWWRFTIEPSTRRILSFEPWPGRPPYIIVRLHDEPTKFWPASSPANDLQAVQNKYSEGWNLLFAGTWMSAFPVPWVKGAQIAEKLKKLPIGGVLEIEGSMAEVGYIPTPFNPDPVLATLSKLEELAQTVSNVSAIGTNQDLPNNTTATQVAAEQQQQQQGEAAYTTHAGYGLEDLVGYMHEVCQLHSGDVLEAYGPMLEPGFIEALEERPTFECVGKVATKGSAAQIAQLTNLYQMAADPQSGLVKPEIARRIVQEMDIDQTDDLFIAPDQLIPNGGLLGLGGDEMVQGLPVGEAGAGNAGLALQQGGGFGQGAGQGPAMGGLAQ